MLTTRDEREIKLNSGYHWSRRYSTVLYAPGGRGGTGWAKKPVGSIDGVDKGV
jgi:hypothetical protein